MSREETAAYVWHLLEVAKLQRPVFSESAIQMLYAASQGLPRVVNQICSQVLFEAEGNETEVVEEMHIGRVLTDMERQRGRQNDLPFSALRHDWRLPSQFPVVPDARTLTPLTVILSPTKYASVNT